MWVGVGKSIGNVLLLFYFGIVEAYINNVLFMAQTLSV